MTIGRWICAISALVVMSSGFACGSNDDDGASGGKTGTGGKGGAGSGGKGGNASGGASGGSGGTSGSGGGAGLGGSAGSGGAPTTCNGDCHYVRSDASGSGDGSDWTNATKELPADLVRGHVYFVATGTYPSYTFDDAAASATKIRVLRATATDHGTDTGWQDGFATGVAVFGTISIKTSDYEIDGRGALRAVGDLESTVVTVDAPSNTVRGLDVDGAFAESNGKQTAGACTGIDVSGDNVVIENNDVHDAADDGIVVSGSSNVSFIGNRIHALHGCGTDGGCGPCYNGHSDGFEIYNVKSSQFIGNMSWDVASTSTFFFGNWADELGGGPSEYCQDILIANNILYNPETGFVIYIEDVVGVNVFNNVFWGQKQGAYGGLAIGTHVKGLTLVNNAILSINYTHLGSTFDAAEHHGEHNLFGDSLGQWKDDASDIVAADPGFSAIPDINGAKVDDPPAQAFAPKAGSPLENAGVGASKYSAIPASDFFGKSRDDTPNIGAIE